AARRKWRRRGGDLRRADDGHSRGKGAADPDSQGRREAGSGYGHGSTASGGARGRRDARNGRRRTGGQGECDAASPRPTASGGTEEGARGVGEDGGDRVG